METNISQNQTTSVPQEVPIIKETLVTPTVVSTAPVAQSSEIPKSTAKDFFFSFAFFIFTITHVSSLIAVITKIIEKKIPLPEDSVVSSSLSLWSGYGMLRSAEFPLYSIATLVTSTVFLSVFLLVEFLRERKNPKVMLTFISILEKSAIIFICITGVFGILYTTIYNLIQSDFSKQNTFIALSSTVIFLSIALYHFFLVKKNLSMRPFVRYGATVLTYLVTIAVISTTFILFERPVSPTKLREDSAMSANLQTIADALKRNYTKALPDKLSNEIFTASTNTYSSSYSSSYNSYSSKPKKDIDFSKIKYTIVKQLTKSDTNQYQLEGTFSLCATFNASSTVSSSYSSLYYSDMYYDDYYKDKANYYSHKKGENCFTEKVTTYDYSSSYNYNYNSGYSSSSNSYTYSSSSYNYGTLVGQQLFRGSATSTYSTSSDRF